MTIILFSKIARVEKRDVKSQCPHCDCWTDNYVVFENGLVMAFCPECLKRVDNGEATESSQANV